MKEILKQLRETNRYSQSAIAAYLGVSRQMYAKYENGEYEPSVNSIRLLSKLYKVSYEVIIENKIINQEAKYKIPDEAVMVVAEPEYVTSAANNSSVQFNHICNEIRQLVYTEQVKLISYIGKILETKSLNQNNKAFEKLTTEQCFELFEELNGCIDKAKIDVKKEKLDYLDERYKNEHID